MCESPKPESAPQEAAQPLGRRRFLYLAGGTAGALAIGASQWEVGVRDSIATSTSVPSSTPTSSAGATAATTTGRPLVIVVNLAGGNDSLNTFVPTAAAEVGRYRDLRPAVGVDEADLIDVGTAVALHPSLAPIMPLWEANRAAAVLGLGIDGQGRSHFAATDTLFAGQTASADGGWVGRWLDTHPNAGEDPLLAVALGGGGSAVRGLTGSSTVIDDPDNFLLRTAPGMDVGQLSDVFLATASPGAAPSSSTALDLVRTGIPRAVNAVDVLDQIEQEVDDASLESATATGLLRTAARLVELNLSTEVVFVEIGGFDTHANQVGTHDALLADVAQGIAEFFETVEAAAPERNVLLVTTSEFGRRAADNGSGTDHGAGAGHLVVGPAMNEPVVGTHGLDALIDGDLPISIPTTSLYAMAIRHLGGDPSAILQPGWADLGLIQ